jgi:hypothetical protein
METKKETIKRLTISLLNQAHEDMIQKVDTLLESGAVEINDWDNKTNPLILPKTLTTAILKHESTLYDGAGTSFEKKVKKDVKNLILFL